MSGWREEVLAEDPHLLPGPHATTFVCRAFPTNAATFFTVEWTYRILLDYDLIGYVQRMSMHSGGRRRYVSAYDLWQRNCFLLPEAGSTCIEPMLHNCRFISR